MGETTMVSADKAAEMLATTQVRILMLVKQKHLTGDLVDGEWQITLESVESFKAGGGGLPPVTPACHATCKSSSCSCS